MRQSEKQRINLARRKTDYDKMIASGKADSYKGYRKPGSNKKRR